MSSHGTEGDGVGGLRMAPRVAPPRGDRHAVEPVGAAGSLFTRPPRRPLDRRSRSMRYSPGRYAAGASWSSEAVADMVVAMAEERFPIVDARRGPRAEGNGRTYHRLTEADYAALVRGLESVI